jgi:hypothetical protein
MKLRIHDCRTLGGNMRINVQRTALLRMIVAVIVMKPATSYLIRIVR